MSEERKKSAGVALRDALRTVDERDGEVKEYTDDEVRGIALVSVAGLIIDFNLSIKEIAIAIQQMRKADEKARKEYN